jgi:small-conductance mechanosensitive channel
VSEPSPSARRHARTPRLLRASQLVLVAGAVISAAAAFGPSWLVRIGIGLAIAAGVIALVLAFRHLRSVRREQSAKVLKITKDHGKHLTAERQRNAEVVQVLTERATAAGDKVRQQQVRIGELNTKVTQLTGDNATLRSEVKSREVTIAGLRETVKSRDTEIQLLRADLDLEALADAGGEVQGLPRRVQGHGDDDAAEDGEDSLVIDMRAVESVMPNFEVDQRKRA